MGDPTVRRGGPPHLSRSLPMRSCLIVFGMLTAACVAVATFIASSFVRSGPPVHPELVESPAEALEQIRQEEL